MVFGSMVTGDLWEESDIDLFVVTNEDIKVEKYIHKKRTFLFMSK